MDCPMSSVREIGGSLFTRIEPGIVWVGSAERMDGDPANRPFKAQVTRPFWLSTLPVTQKLWHEIMGKVFHDEWMKRIEHFVKYEKYTSEEIGIGPGFPMHTITYEEAVFFCSKITQTCPVSIQLPTECEWELAAQSGFGFNNTNGNGVAVTQETGWFNEGGMASSMMKQVGLRPGNEIILKDMYGLVWELVRGRYRSASGDEFDNWIWPDCYPANGSEVIDFEASCDSPNLCVAKGGSIYSRASEISSGLRLSQSPDYYFIDIGFRMSFYEEKP